MDTNVRLSLMRLSRVFRNIYAKVWDPTSLPSLREDVVVTLSMIEWECTILKLNLETLGKNFAYSN